MNLPVWLDDHIYAAPDCPAIDADFQRAAEALTEIASLLAALPETRDINPLRHLLRAIRRQANAVRRQAWNSQTFAYNRLSSNGRDEAARVLLSRGQQLQARLAQLVKPVALFWLNAPEDQVRALLQDPELFELAYLIRHDRRLQRRGALADARQRDIDFKPLGDLLPEFFNTLPVGRVQRGALDGREGWLGVQGA